jgi:vesicle-associated membrane protein 72
VFLVVANEGMGRSVPFVFLERVKEDFMQKYGSAISDEEEGHPLADEDDDLFEDRFSIAYSLDREFGYSLEFKAPFLSFLELHTRYHFDLPGVLNNSHICI